MTIHIEILQVTDCPHAEIAHRRVLDASTDVSIALTVTHVRDDTDAARRGMRGSPTILIEGVDPFNDLDEPTSCSCRVRPGQDPVPTDDDIRRALQR